MLLSLIKVFFVFLKENIRRLNKKLNKFLVQKKKLDSEFEKLAERHKPQHPRLAQLEEKYESILFSKDSATKGSHNEPSKEDSSKKKKYFGMIGPTKTVVVNVVSL